MRCPELACVCKHRITQVLMGRTSDIRLSLLSSLRHARFAQILGLSDFIAFVDGGFVEDGNCKQCWLLDLHDYCPCPCAQVVPVAAYDGRFDVWTIDALLSDGCDGPALPEEVML